MDRFVWGREFKTGIPEMDCEHVMLLSLYNQLCTVIDSEKEREALDDIINALVTYIKLHFQHEEQMLERTGYAGLAEHRAAHRALIKSLDDIHAGYCESGDITVARNLRSLVLSWLAGHILKDDKAYGAALMGVRGE